MLFSYEVLGKIRNSKQGKGKFCKGKQELFQEVKVLFMNYKAIMGTSLMFIVLFFINYFIS